MLSVINLDLGKRELQNARIQNLAAAPASPVTGQVYYDTVLNQFGCFQNATWVYLSAAGAANVSKAANASAASVLQVSGGADKTIADFTSAGGIVKVSATGVVTLAVAGTDYLTAASSNALTNKTFDAAGTGNSLLNVTTANFALNIIDTDSTLSANSDTRIASQKAVKSYADAIQQGIKWKEPVRAATSAAGALATSFANASVIDGVTLATGDRILIKNQSSGAENGIYIVQSAGAPIRATDNDTAGKIAQTVVDVREGTVNADQAYVLTNDGVIVVGTTVLVFVDFVKASVPAASTSVAGKVLLASLTEAEAKTDSLKAVVSSDLTNFSIKRIATIGDGTTTAIVVTDNLNTIDKMAIVRDATSNAQILVDITYALNTTTITFAVAPATNGYKVVIVG